MVRAQNMLQKVGSFENCRAKALSPLIGNTPLLAIKLRHKGRDLTIYAKAEMYNLSGSIKDRMALSILSEAKAAGLLKPGQPIAEATSGNAGIAIAALGRAMGHPVTIYMPDWMSMERRHILASHGATVKLISKDEGGFLGAIALAEKMGEAEGAFLPRQFSNPSNVTAHYTGTAPEIWAQLETLGENLSGFVAGVGTGGTVMGCGRYFKGRDASIRVHPVEPVESPTMSTGYKVGHHRIQGVSDEFIPEIVKLDELDKVMAVHDGDSILMAQKIARELGLGVGISSGGNLIAAIELAMTMDCDGCAVATVFCDNNMKYLSTDLAREEPVKAGYITPETELLNIRTIR